jgi:hypothetical protein
MSSSAIQLWCMWLFTTEEIGMNISKVNCPRHQRKQRLSGACGAEAKRKERRALKEKLVFERFNYDVEDLRLFHTLLGLPDYIMTHLLGRRRR